MSRDKDGMKWATEVPHMRYAFWVAGKPISPAHARKISRIVNILAAIVRRKVTVAETAQSLLSYTRAFVVDYGVRLVDVRIMNIVENMMA